MKNLLILLVFSVIFFSCEEKENQVTNQTPVYEEFTSTDNINEQTENVNNNVVSDVNQTDTVAYQSDIKLSLDNLNENLADQNQTVVFSFKTENGKTLSLLTDSKQTYLVYRYGKSEKVEFQYPDKIDETSWQKFYFESYKTDVENLMHIYFVNVDYKYTIYFNENFTTKNTKAGVQVKSLNNNKTTDIKADLSSIKGGLEYFKTNSKVSK